MSPHYFDGRAPKAPKINLTFGQKAADRLTQFCGSWKFIILALTFIFFWIGLNTYSWINHWDPWPFIFLNLTLSCVAALQAPIILMSQIRQAERDRINQKYDYLVDRKAEREVQEIMKNFRHLRKKLDIIETKINSSQHKYHL